MQVNTIDQADHLADKLAVVIMALAGMEADEVIDGNLHMGLYLILDEVQEFLREEVK